MKFILFVLALCCCSWLCAQTRAEKRLIDSIEKQVLQKTFTKAESIDSTGWNGADKMITVYFKKRQPVLIVQEEKQETDAELTDGSREVTTSLYSAKFYIQNWRNNTYIRVGTIENTSTHYTDKKNEPVKNKVVMSAEFEFTYDRQNVERLMVKKGKQL